MRRAAVPMAAIASRRDDHVADVTGVAGRAVRLPAKRRAGLAGEDESGGIEVGLREIDQFEGVGPEAFGCSPAEVAFVP